MQTDTHWSPWIEVPFDKLGNLNVTVLMRVPQGAGVYAIASKKSTGLDLPPGVRQTVKTQVAVRWKSIVRRVALTSILRSWTTAVCLLPRRPFAASWQRCLTSCI